jgi:hypothetical protein
MEKVAKVTLKETNEEVGVLYQSATSTYVDYKGSAIWVDTASLVFHVGRN